MKTKAPWLKSYKNVPHSLIYPDLSMAELVLQTAKEYPDYIAYEFFGSAKSYTEFEEQIRLCAKGLYAIGVRQGDRLTICMPNTPQAVIVFYAINLIGAVANMVHPLSAEEEIVRFIRDSRSKMVITLDQFSEKLVSAIGATKAEKLILTGIEDALSGAERLFYKLTKGRKITRIPTDKNVIRYKDVLKEGENCKEDYFASSKGEDVAAILYSGGTSGTSKGVVLTNNNFNALALQTMAAGDCVEAGCKMLALMPVFHGFGLGVCIHTALVAGGTAILVPQFSLKGYVSILKKQKPHYIAGVPTLFDALLRVEGLNGVDMSQLKGIFCGGDSLSIELKRKVDEFLRSHGSKEQVREGYGLTECVSASCLTPRTFHKEGSIGIPYPDMYYKVVKPGTTDEMPYGEDGEIVISGPTVMKGYDNNKEETENALRAHPDGCVWLHTGDLGALDEEGFVYFKQRIKRMIVSSGYSIYPSQLENAIESHENVLISCVIGIPDEHKGQRIKAYISLKGDQEVTEEIRESIIKHCKKHIAKYAMPSEFEYRKELPRTLVGKVAYLELEKEELM